MLDKREQHPIPHSMQDRLKLQHGMYRKYQYICIFFVIYISVILILFSKSNEFCNFLSIMFMFIENNYCVCVCVFFFLKQFSQNRFFNQKKIIINIKKYVIIFVAIVDVVLVFIIIFIVINIKNYFLLSLSYILCHIFGNFLKDL